MFKATVQAGKCGTGRWRGLTLPSIRSSHWSPRFVTILGVLSSTGRMSTWNCWGAAVIIWGRRGAQKLIIHRHLNCQVWNPEISWHFRVGAKLVSTTCHPLAWDLGRILPAKGHYKKESEKPGAQGWDFTCHGSWRLHTSACSKFNVTPRWNNKQNIFLSITLVKSFLRGRRKPSLKC